MIVSCNICFIVFISSCVTVALHHLDDNANATQAYEQAAKLDV